MNIFCLGLGYSAQRFATLYGEDYFIAGSVRSEEKASLLEQKGFQTYLFDGLRCSDRLVQTLHETDALIVSIPPGEFGDGGDLIGRALEGTTKLKSILYLSTIGVYGDRHGAWVTEQDPATPMQPRSIKRFAAEQNWQRLGAALNVKTGIFRLAGIYGPGQNAIEQMRGGFARRIIKPGQVFNRIHVDDIARVLHQALQKPTDAIYNVTDDEPAPPQDVISYAAKLLGVEPPPDIDWQKAGLSAMALSFYEENKRVSNALIRAEFGDLLFPTYREGLRSFL